MSSARQSLQHCLHRVETYHQRSGKHAGGLTHIWHTSSSYSMCLSSNVHLIYTNNALTATNQAKAFCTCSEQHLLQKQTQAETNADMQNQPAQPCSCMLQPQQISNPSHLSLKQCCACCCRCCRAAGAFNNSRTQQRIATSKINNAHQVPAQQEASRWV